MPIVGLRMGLSLPLIGVILAANRAMRVVSSPFVGVFTDRFGARRTLLVGLLLQIVVMALYAVGIVTRHPGPLFLLGRLVHGPGSACVFVAAQTLALHAGGASHGGRAASTVRASIVLGVPVGLVVGGLLSDAVGDAATFVIAGGALLLALVGTWARVPDVRASLGVRPPLAETLGAMRDRRLLAVGALNFAVNFATVGMVLTTMAILVHERHLSLLGRSEQGTSGLLMGWMLAFDLASTPLAGIVGDTWHAHARVATASIALLVPAMVLIGLSGHAAGLAAGLALVGIGTAGLSPSLLVIMGTIVPRESRGTGAGVLQLCGDVGGTLGPLVGTALFGGNTAVPYLGTAGLLVCLVPVAAWLGRLEAAAS